MNNKLGLFGEQGVLAVLRLFRRHLAFGHPDVLDLNAIGQRMFVGSRLVSRHPATGFKVAAADRQEFHDRDGRNS